MNLFKQSTTGHNVKSATKLNII